MAVQMVWADMIAEAEAHMGIVMRDKHKGPTNLLAFKEPSLSHEKMLDVDPAHLAHAKNMELMKRIKLRFIPEGANRTLDEYTVFPRTATIDGMSAQQTIMELREAVALQEGLPLKDVNFWSLTTDFDDNTKLADCYLDWMGSGLDDWPPKFIVKPAVQGFEVHVDIPKMRDTSVWEGGKLQCFGSKNLIFDVQPEDPIWVLKKHIEEAIKIPAERAKLTAHLRKNVTDHGYYLDLDDDNKTFAEYEYDIYGLTIKFEKSFFDADGNYVFDDGFFDSDGWHAQPAGCWIHPDSLIDRSRPDANPVDPFQPAVIITDRRMLHGPVDLGTH